MEVAAAHTCCTDADSVPDCGAAKPCCCRRRYSGCWTMGTGGGASARPVCTFGMTTVALALRSPWVLPEATKLLLYLLANMLCMALARPLAGGAAGDAAAGAATAALATCCGCAGDCWAAAANGAPDCPAVS